MIGGHWGESDLWQSIGQAYSFSDKYLLLAKFLWREGFIRTPDSCSADTPGNACMPTCPRAIIGQDIDNHTAFTLLHKAGISALNPLSDFDDVLKDYDLDWSLFLKELCHIGYPGEMFTSAAPQDPTFWPLHGNGDRFVMYLRVLKAKQVFDFDETWKYAHETQLPSDTGMVCDWSTVKDVTDMPTCTKDICPGHKEDDLLPFTNLFSDQKDSLLSNRQLYDRVNPYHEDLPYVYDSLSYWEGCHEHSLISTWQSKWSNDANSTDSTTTEETSLFNSWFWGVF